MGLSEQRLTMGLGLTLAILVGLAVFAKPADFWLTRDQQADRLFASANYSAAAEMYQDPARRGVALFRDGAFEESASWFARADEPESAFNRGNALVMLGQYEAAIQSYDRALQLKPGWQRAEDNRAIAIVRRDNLEPSDDDAGGTGGMLEADEIVFDDRAKNSSESQEIDVGAGDKMSDDELRAIWLQRVQTSPGDFLRAKFSYQLAKREANEKPQETP